MKYLVYFFLLANIVLFLWRQAAPGDVVASKPPAESEAKKLKLLAETQPPRPAIASGSAQLDSRRDSVSESAPGTPRATTPEYRCYTLGPFDERTVETVSGRLKALADTVQQRQITEQEQYGYQVFIPSLPSLVQARRVAGQLREKGLSDYFIMTGDANPNAISLGLFREKRYASRHLDHVTGLGFDAVMEPRYRQRVRFWLNYRDDKGRVDAGILRELTGDKPVQRLEHDCRGLL